MLQGCSAVSCEQNTSSCYWMKETMHIPGKGPNGFFLFSFIRIPPINDQEPDTNLVTLRNLVLTLWRGGEQGFFTEGDPLWLVGSDDMVQGRHAKRMLLIFTLLTSSRPQKDVWGEQGSSTASLGLQSITDVGECSNQNRDKTGPPWLWSICQAESCLNEKGNWNW